MMLLATCCLVASVAHGPATPSPHMPWEPLLTDPRSDVEVDRSRIRREHGFAEIWVRSRGKPEAIAAEFVAAGVEADRVERVRAAFQRSEHLWSFRCEDRTHALAYSAYYATDGSLISDFKVGQLTYWPVQPDTVGVRLLQAACGDRHAGAPDGDADGDGDGDGDGDEESTAAAPR
jgi:hypothetical protein